MRVCGRRAKCWVMFWQSMPLFVLTIWFENEALFVLESPTFFSLVDSSHIYASYWHKPLWKAKERYTRKETLFSIRWHGEWGGRVVTYFLPNPSVRFASHLVLLPPPPITGFIDVRTTPSFSLVATSLCVGHCVGEDSALGLFPKVDT